MITSSNNLYKSKWLTVVFSGRNQQYGAYQLRQHSANYLIKAFLIAGISFVVLFLSPSIYTAFRNETKPVVTADDKIVVIDINQPVKSIPKEEKKIQLPVQDLPKASAAPKVKSVAMSANIKVVKDELTQMLPPTSEEIKEAVIASTTQEGVSGLTNTTVGDGEVGRVGFGNSNRGNVDDIYEVAGLEVFPEFPGGMNAWTKFIQRNLRYPAMALEEGIQGKVFLSFIVEKDGTINEIKILRGIGFGCDEEALRVIKKSPRWKAGMQNNLPVRVRFQMPISYTLQN